MSEIVERRVQLRSLAPEPPGPALVGMRRITTR